MRFRAEVELGGKTATGIHVPDEVVAGLAGSGRPAVIVTVNGHSYRSTVARMGGRHLVPLSAENRTAAGVRAGDEVEVGIELDTAPREVVVPADLGAAMDPDVRSFFDTLAFTHRKEWVRWVEEAKRPQTRADRVVRTVEALREGKRTR